MNKGFTLVELIAVIVILALLVVITTPAYDTISSSIKERTYKSKQNTIASETLNYVEKYLKDKVYSGTSDEGKYICFTVNFLIRNGIISSDSDKSEYISNEFENRDYKDEDIYIRVGYDTNLLKLKAESIDKDPFKEEDCTFKGTKYIY